VRPLGSSVPPAVANLRRAFLDASDSERRDFLAWSQWSLTSWSGLRLPPDPHRGGLGENNWRRGSRNPED